MSHDIDRDSGIGGSESPIVVTGECYRRTRQDLANQKTGLVEPPDFQSGDIQRGKYLEPYVLERVAFRCDGEITDKQLEVGEGILFGHIDGILRSPMGDYLVEVKCPRMKTVWQCASDGLRDSYIIQCNHYMHLLRDRGLAGYIVAIWSCDEWDVDLYEAQPDEALTDEIIRKSQIFWDRCVIGGELCSDVFEEDTPVDIPRIGGCACEAPPRIQSLARDLQLVTSVARIQRDQADKIKQAIMDAWPVQENGQPYRKIRIPELVTLTLSPGKMGLSLRTRWSEVKEEDE